MKKVQMLHKFTLIAATLAFSEIVNAVACPAISTAQASTIIANNPDNFNGWGAFLTRPANYSHAHGVAVSQVTVVTPNSVDANPIAQYRTERCNYTFTFSQEGGPGDDLHASLILRRRVAV